MRYLLTAVLSIFLLTTTSPVRAQLVGSLSIPGNYSTLTDAITDLDSQGVGSGGVVFNIAAGYTETASNLAIDILVNLPNSANQVVFQKSGSGANPLITAAPGSSATTDGIIKIVGADYITFDRIDLLDPSSNAGNAAMESGYSLLRKSTTDGCQSVVIKNCNITLQKINTAAFGIYIVNRDLSGAIVTASDPSGQHNGNKVYGNTITNVYKGIVLISASTARDKDNEIGVMGEQPNTITNWGGGTVAAEGVRCEGQINVMICNNDITGGAGTTNAVVGIIATLFGATGSAPNYEICHNRVTVTASSSSSATYGIRALATGDTVRIHHNTVENCNTAHASSAFNGISHDQVGTTNASYLHDNIVRNNSHSGTGNANLLVGTGTYNYLLIRSNQVYGNQKTGASGIMNCIQVSNAAIECDSNDVYNNSITSSSGATASTVYGYINSGSPTNENIHDNSIYNLSIGGSGTSASNLVVGIRTNSAAGTTKFIYGNSISGLSTIGGTSTTGGAYGIYSTTGSTVTIHSNKINDITNTGATGTAAGCWVSSGVSVLIYNNFIANIKAPNSSNANAVIGINSTSTATLSTLRFYFNTIYLNASSSATSFGSSGISVAGSTVSTTASLDLKSNIVVNLSAPGSLSGQTVAYRRSNVNLANYVSDANYNLYYAGTPATNRLIYADGVNGDQTIDLYKTRMAPRETNSNSVTVNFANAANGDLHIAGASIGSLDLLGMPAGNILADIDLDIRNDNYPYKGADESSAITIPTLNLTLNLEAISPVQDTVTVLLRNATNPYSVIGTSKGYLSPTGTVSLKYAKAADGVNYYIVVTHRNSVETWSKAGGETFSSGVLNYDFTTAASQAYGSNQKLVGSEYSVYTGDVNNDGIVDAADASLIDNDAAAFVTGYVDTDLNYDNTVDGTDAVYADNNVFNYVGLVRP